MTDWRPGAVIALNMGDAVCTLHAVATMGVSFEANPLMRELLRWGVVDFLMVKLAAVTWAVCYMDRHLKGRARWPLTALVWLGAVLMCWHLWGLSSVV